MDVYSNYLKYLPHDRLQAFIETLQHAGYTCIGPQVRDGAIIFDVLDNVAQLPWGISDDQAPGKYRLVKTDKRQAFAWVNGPQAIKPWLFKSRESVWRVTRDATGKLSFEPVPANDPPLAIIGVHACDLAGMAVQDKVFITDKYVDQRYRKRREQLLLIAVNCTTSGANCFCVSAGTGPCVKNNYDIVLTELTAGFLVQVGSERGEKIINELHLDVASEDFYRQACEKIKQAENEQTKRIPLNNTRALRDLLFNNLDHPRWQEVAERCLSCGNCTQVCPTCFCHSEQDETNLDGHTSHHQQEWDSCFTAGHSYLNGTILRDDTRKRYRQWLTHKVGSWFDQFDVSGCVGCGRCITWCPVGIDITEELAAISGESNVRDKSDET